ncbi:unnamed protein product [Brachionus calyciflorus]|uniref:Nitric oxide synthase n=1 Tax=Brachionus calyciflorus TaxID=104777 RepID=A0A813WV77_9BILA|nr:unnamed protein product [Brachionus calyciflorus]
MKSTNNGNFLIKKPANQVNKSDKNFYFDNGLKIGVKKDLQTKCPFTIHSFSDDRTFSESLHTKSAKGIGCSEKFCKGSILKTQSLKFNQQKNKQEAIKEHFEFLDQYYESINKKTSTFHIDRINLSDKHFRKTGTFYLTFSELEFAVKTSWRNSARCIGRINWSNIKLFDGRNCTTTKEMFDLLCQHIRYANNGGNIQSAITVFRQRINGMYDFRIWNSQLINYAGYQLSESETIGDKSQIEFTRICESLGWKGKRTEHDILPLVLQANGNAPDIYEIPEDLIVQVDILHPKNESFKKLQLKWFGVPAVSSMCMDAAGIFFNCVAFNGWYMNTEIGRDLIEANRYNKLNLIAKVLNLDISNNSTLWKDEVLLETNKAILYSFNKAGVTIVDLHSAAESFVKHYENEIVLRGGTPADWVWINPSMSAHITPIFGLEMLNYVVKPYFEYQEMPKLQKKIIKFKTLIRCIKPFLTNFRSKIQNRPKCSIYYASQTGKAKDFSNKVFNLYNKSFNTKVMPLNELNLERINDAELILIIASTTGDGESPSNGKIFEEKIHQNSNLQSNMKNTVKFSILGLGDKTYGENFGAFPKLIHSFFKSIGLSEMYPLMIADQMENEENTMLSWLKQSFMESSKVFSEKIKLQENEIEKMFSTKLFINTIKKLRFSPCKESSSSSVISNLSNINDKNLRNFEIIHREIIGFRQDNEPILRLKLRCKDLQYSPGDHIEIFAENAKENVNFVLSRLNNSQIHDEILKFEVLDESFSNNSSEFWLSDKKYPNMSIRQALTYYFDINKPISQDGLKILANKAINEKEKELLKNISEDWKEYELWKKDYPNLVAVLRKYLSLSLDVESLLVVLPQMKSRFYSISSILNNQKNEVEITFAILKYETKINGSVYYGLCSKFLGDSEIGKVISAEIIESKKFKLPKDLSLPVILIGSGTGIAPFRSFWIQRQSMLQRKSTDLNIGDFALIYGCREKEKDLLYSKEIENLRAAKIINDFYPAFSRDPNFPKEYVQDKIYENKERIIELINRGAHIYICGRSDMSNGVTKAINQIYDEKLNLSGKVNNQDVIKILKQENRFHQDIFNS